MISKITVCRLLFRLLLELLYHCSLLSSVLCRWLIGVKNDKGPAPLTLCTGATLFWGLNAFLPTELGSVNVAWLSWWLVVLTCVAYWVNKRQGWAAVKSLSAWHLLRRCSAVSLSVLAEAQHRWHVKHHCLWLSPTVSQLPSWRITVGTCRTLIIVTQTVEWTVPRSVNNTSKPAWRTHLARRPACITTSPFLQARYLSPCVCPGLFAMTGILQWKRCVTTLHMIAWNDRVWVSRVCVCWCGLMYRYVRIATCAFVCDEDTVIVTVRFCFSKFLCKKTSGGCFWWLLECDFRPHSVLYVWLMRYDET